jgi:hypothetical protein
VGLRIGVSVFAAAFTADLVTKAAVVSTHAHTVYFNTPRHGLPLRLLMCAVAAGMAFLMTRAAAWRGLGRPWGAWIGGGLLVGGVLANGVSPLLWHAGVPDWIVNGDWIGNVADFEIFFGLMGGFLSLALGACVVYARGAVASRSARSSSSSTNPSGH